MISLKYDLDTDVMEARLPIDKVKNCLGTFIYQAKR